MILAFISGMSNGTATTTPASTLTAPVVEIRAYQGKGPQVPVLILVECYSYDDPRITKASWRLSRLYDGVEVAVIGDYEEVTDTWGVTPTDLRMQAEDSGEWAREIAREAGMLGGIAAYNEVMGY